MTGRLCPVLAALLPLTAPASESTAGALAAPAAPAALIADRTAVERVYYGHRLGNKLPFEQALPAETIRQLVRLDLTAAPTTLDEGGSSQLQTTATLDDATQLRLSAGEVRWHVFLGPVESIGSNGVVQFGTAFQDSVASIQAGYQNRFGGARFRILNAGLDDFGIYAHDGIPDLWQVQQFGANNPRGTAVADPDGDGQNNLFEYMAGLSPTNSESHFTLEIAALPDLPNEKALIFSPRLAGRTYVLEVSTNLAAGFAPLTGAQQLDFGATRFVLDPNATAPNRFYRVKISVP